MVRQSEFYNRENIQSAFAVVALDVSAPGNTATFDTGGRNNVSWIVELKTLTGTNITFSWEHSPDGTNWYLIAAETAQTGVGFKQRLDVENTMRYLRVSWVETAVTVATADIYIQASV